MFFLIYLQYLVEVPGKINHQSIIYCLTNKAASCRSGQYWGFVISSEFNGSLNVIGRFRDEYTVRHDLIYAGIGAVKHTTVFVSP